MLKKIICTGNTFAPSITHYLDQLYPDITFVSRTTGFDLSTQEGLDKFKSILPYYNVFINHSQLMPGVQETLLKYAHEVWKYGHVINIGSILEFDKWEWFDPESAVDKRALRDLSLSLSSENFKTTHIIIGGLKTPDNDFILESKQVADMIKFVIEAKCYIPLLYIDNINDKLEEKWLSLKP